MEGLNDRIKKLKGLLSKVNSLAQEKEVKLNQLQSHHDPAKRFSIVVKLSSRSHSDDVDDDDRHEMIHWCLIYEHSVSTHEATDTAGMIVDATTSTTATTTMNTSPLYRWIEERIVHKWISEGSILVGEWPQSMQDKHNHDLHTMRSRLENERDKLIAQNSEVTNQFQSYKIRAQTALKRIGTEDRHEKLKVIEQESAEIERLKNIINGYKDKENELMIEIGRKDGMIVEKDEEKGRLLSQIELLDSAILDNEQKLQIMERKITLQQKEIDSLHDENRSLEEQYEAAEKSHRERLRALQKQRNTSNDFMMMDDDAKGYQSNNGYNLSNNNSNNNYNNNNNNSSNSHPSNSAPGYNNQNITAVNNNTSTSSQLSSSSTSALASASSIHSSDPSTTNDTTTQIHISSSSILKRDDPSIEAEAVIAEPIDEVIDSTNMNMHQSSTKLLLFKQADNILHESIISLRKENSQLQVEMNDLKQEVGLQLDQMSILKDTIKDLELSLSREKEFNAGDHRINADYLVNVLRNFLMATDPNERSKLVSVICQILQFRPDEMRIINQKWALKGGSGSGLAGWFRGNSSVAVNINNHHHHSNSSSSGGKNAGGTVDASYNASTGLDVNMF